ncbi:MAG: ATP-binding protein [Candidatus Aminicenantes bacterium]|jgi:signal transduction histidine kinase
MNIFNYDKTRLIKTIIPKISSFRLIILIGGLLAFVLAISIVLIIFLENITQTATFRDQVIIDESEGSLSKNLGLLAMLETEISSYLDLESNLEREIVKKIKNYLLDLKYRIEELKQPKTGISIDENSNIEKETDQGRLISWLHPDSLSQINFKNLNLKKYSFYGHPERPPLHSSKIDNKSLKSFVWIPTPLVTFENGKIELSTSVKKEIVFSKIIESELVKIIEDLKNEDIWQVYFIPISGFVRILNKDSKDLITYYKDILSAIACFSDRPYFKETMSKNDGFRISNSYIDTACTGVVITYSVFIRNENLGIVGMIGIDRKVEPLNDILKQVKLGSGTIYKDFQYSTHPIAEKECGYCHTGKYGNTFDYKYMLKNFDNEALALSIAEMMENSNKLFKDDLIARMLFRGRESTVYLIDIGKNQKSGKKEVAYFHFNPLYTQRKYQMLMVYFLISLLGVIILMVLTLKFFLAKTEAKKIQTEVVSNLNGGLVIIDRDGCIKFHNSKMAELVGVPDLKDKNFLSDFLPIESKAEYGDLIQISKKGFEFSGRIIRSDSSVFPAIISSASINFPGVSKAQMLIIIPSEQLESTIAANFIHGFSHTLKTPIQSILLLVDRMRRKNLPQPKFDQYFSTMQQQVGEFTTMVTNLLRFSKLEIEGIKPNKETNNLAALLRSVVKPLRERATKANIKLIVNIPESLPANIDRDMFRVILNNLLDNALKYTEEGEISVDAYEEGNQVVISVSDTGIGVPKDERDKIFDKFFRGGAQNVRVKDGIGIGLYVSKKYVTFHYGTLEYKPNIEEEISKKGKEIKKIKRGSKFILKVPKN